MIRVSPKKAIVDMFVGTYHIETVVLLSHRKADTHVEVEINDEYFPLTSAELKSTYNDIKEYVLKKYDVKVTTLDIAQIKNKYGILERECYNSKKENSKYLQPRCIRQKEEYITEALKFYKMIK